MLDAKTGKPRTVIDIANAAELCVSEESRDGLPHTAEDEVILVTRQTRLHESFSQRPSAQIVG